MTTLITGGAGFIGSRLALLLLSQGESVVILDNFNNYYDPALKRQNIEAMDGRVVVIEGDIRDEETVRRVFEEHDIQRVAHLAAMANVRVSAEQGRLYTDVNVGGTVTLIDEARKHNVKVFVFGSTSSVYGNTTQIPFIETDNAAFPLAPYPASKRAAELLTHSYHHLFGVNVTVVRFFNVYGPSGRPDMMPLKALQAIVEGTPITIFDGGTLERDWTYVDDIVDGLVAALQNPMGYKIINLGCGAPISLNRFIEIYEDLIGKKAILQHAETPATELKITYCDNTLARELLGFNPKVGVEEGLARTWDWYRGRYLET